MRFQPSLSYRIKMELPSLHAGDDARVAEAGYVGIAPELYHRNTPEINADHQKRAGSRRDTGVINDVNAAVGFLRGCATADVSKLGIVGFCMGGRVACLMAAANPIFRAAVDFTEAVFTRPGAMVRRHRNARRKFIAPSRVISVNWTRTRQPMKCAPLMPS